MIKKYFLKREKKNNLFFLPTLYQAKALLAVALLAAFHQGQPVFRIDYHSSPQLSCHASFVKKIDGYGLPISHRYQTAAAPIGPQFTWKLNDENFSWPKASSAFTGRGQSIIFVAQTNGNDIGIDPKLRLCKNFDRLPDGVLKNT